MKTLPPEGRINFKRLFLKILKFSENIYVQFVPFNDHRREKGISKKVMFHFELRNVISISCVISTHGKGNNIKKVFWRMTFINFIEAA